MTKVIDKKLLKKLGAKESIKQLDQYLNPNTPVKYIGLVRVSTDKQEQHGQSVGTQIELISRYCKNRHYDLSEIKQFAESASKAERKKFDELLKEIEHSKIKIAIIVTRIDRLTRQYSAKIESLRKRNKLEIHTADDYSTISAMSTPDDLTRMDLNIILAQRESRMLSRRVKEVRTKQMEDGQYPRAALVGYINTTDPATEKKNIEKDPVKAPLVQKVLEEFAKRTYTLDTICEYANKIGLTSKKGQKWVKGNMSSMLHNPFYCGYFIDNGTTYQHKYETLISVDTYEKIQDILTGRNKKAIRANSKDARIFIFSNVIKCQCGCQMTPYEKRKTNGKTYRYLKCSHASRTTPCTVKDVSESVFLDQIKKEVLNKLVIDPEILKIYKPAIRRAIQLDQTTSKQAIVRLQMQKDELEAELKSYIKSVSQGIISKSDFEIAKQDVQDKIATIEEQIVTANISQEHIDEILDRVIKLLKNGAKLFNSSKVVQKNQILKILLSNCVYDGCKLQISLKKPFDILVSNGFSHNWQPHSDLNRDSRLERAVS